MPAVQLIEVVVLKHRFVGYIYSYVHHSITAAHHVEVELSDTNVSVLYGNVLLSYP